MEATVKAITAITSKHRTLDDGTVEYLIRVPSEESSTATARAMLTAGCNIAILPLAYKEARYGEQAKALRLSGFFFAPEVWRHIGSDDDYQKWVRKQPSAICKKYGNVNNPIEFAHVRRVNTGSGVAAKGNYAGIPLLRSEHRLQHKNGESALKPPQWFDQQRIKYVTEWAWLRLKDQLGYEHWNQVPPMVLKQWCDSRELTKYLPKKYLEGVE